MNLGDKLKKLRKDKYMTMETLANEFNAKFKTGTYKAAISKWENNKQIPNTKSLQMYCDYFNVSMDYLNGYTSKASRDIEPTIEEIRAKLNESELIELDTLITLNTTMFQKRGDLKDYTKEQIIKALTIAFYDTLPRLNDNK